MREEAIKAVPELKDLPILDEDDPEAAAFAEPSCLCDIAEADDPIRLHDLLHRRHYRPVAAVRFHRTREETTRVYFLRDERCEECCEKR